MGSCFLPPQVVGSCSFSGCGADGPELKLCWEQVPVTVHWSHLSRPRALADHRKWL